MMRGGCRGALALGALVLCGTAGADTWAELGWSERRGDFGSGRQQRLEAPWLALSHWGTRWSWRLWVPYYRLQVDGIRETGWGDVLAGLFWSPPARGTWRPALGAAVKWPTGDPARGLGSGGTDWSVQAGAVGALGRATQLGLQAGYTWTGDSEGAVAYRDFASLGAGLWHRRGRFLGRLEWAWRGASSAAVPAARELGIGLRRLFSPRLWGELRWTRGLSDGAPEQGWDLTVARRF